MNDLQYYYPFETYCQYHHCLSPYFPPTSFIVLLYSSWRHVRILCWSSKTRRQRTLQDAEIKFGLTAIVVDYYGWRYYRRSWSRHDWSSICSCSHNIYCFNSSSSTSIEPSSNLSDELWALPIDVPSSRPSIPPSYLSSSIPSLDRPKWISHYRAKWFS